MKRPIRLEPGVDRGGEATCSFVFDAVCLSPSGVAVSGRTWSEFVFWTPGAGEEDRQCWMNDERSAVVFEL